MMSPVPFLFQGGTHVDLFERTSFLFRFGITPVCQAIVEAAGNVVLRSQEAGGNVVLRMIEDAGNAALRSQEAGGNVVLRRIEDAGNAALRAIEDAGRLDSGEDCT